uniref:Origin recognition complex subunit 5 C-terminal domain-containing protein n=1 Tax=Alexandrium catenella TaxID=2925 RepID=A0A7S1L2M5_ALECA|mmetsp:Transcript_105269/g.280268  ORF Transcript_105269/g.280268 Transcript_105269/m.280268 type:complete len:558 (+) Transcript_105269:31-1704(+)
MAQTARAVRELSPAPGSPQPRKKRILGRNFSDEKVADPLLRRHPARPLFRTDALKSPAVVAGTEQPKRRLQLQEVTQAAAVDRELLAELDSYGVPLAGRALLFPLLKRFGVARAAEVLGLWTFLGDGGVSRPVSASTLQVWGMPGTGKTEVVTSYLREFGIRHVRLNCACFATVGEFQARLAEELRRLAASHPSAPRELLRQAPPGRQIRALDRLEAALRPSLEVLRECDAAGSAWPAKVVLALDQAEELPRLGPGLLQQLLGLPEVLQQGGVLTVVMISRLPLCSLGLPPSREPPAVEFRPYTEAQAEELLLRLLAKAPRAPNAPDLRTLCGSGLVKFAAPALGWNLHHLLRIGQEVLAETHFPAARGGGIAAMQRRIERAVHERVGLCDLSTLLEPGEVLEPSTASAMATVRRMTKEECRLLLAAYLGARVDKDDDAQLFLPMGGRSKGQRRGAVTKKVTDGDADVPIFARPPHPVPLVRLLAIYHRLARAPALVGPLLFERLMNLKEAGLLRFTGERQPCGERDFKVICRAELPLARACAGDVDVDIAEFLCKY